MWPRGPFLEDPTVTPARALAVAIALSIVATACGGRAVPAPDPRVAEPDFGRSLAGVVPDTLDAQLAEGERVFVSECADCHGVDGRGGAGPPLFGVEGLSIAPRPESARSDAFETAADLVEWLQEHMPADHPGTLSEGAYYNVAAYVLAMNRVPLAHAPLDESTAHRLVLAEEERVLPREPVPPES